MKLVVSLALAALLCSCAALTAKQQRVTDCVVACAEDPIQHFLAETANEVHPSEVIAGCLPIDTANSFADCLGEALNNATPDRQEDASYAGVIAGICVVQTCQGLL
jgi:hypothetical protein